MKLEFLTDFRKILKNQISLKSVECEPSFSMRMGWQTDRQRRTEAKLRLKLPRIELNPLLRTKYNIRQVSYNPNLLNYCYNICSVTRFILSEQIYSV